MTSKTHAIEILAVIITSVVLGYIGVISAIQLVAVDTPPPNTQQLRSLLGNFTGRSNTQMGQVLLGLTEPQLHIRTAIAAKITYTLKLGRRFSCR